MSTGDVKAKTSRVRDLNDAFRKTFSGGRLLLTSGINDLPSDVRAMAIRKVAAFAKFDEDNDPHGEHDFGAFDLAGHRIFWKIDCFAPDLEQGSEDPGDPAKTTRVMTIMRAEEY